MVSRRTLLLGLLAAGLASALPAAARTPEVRAAKLNAVLQQLVEGRTTPGAAVLILQDGKPIYDRAVGVRDLRGGEPLRADHLFRMASMTKPVTSLAFMALVEQGMTSLDQPVAAVVPELERVQVYAGGGGGG